MDQEAKGAELHANLVTKFAEQYQHNNEAASRIIAVETRLAAQGGFGGAGTDKPVKLDRKDCKVEKLEDKADVIDFRQWIRTIELQLESVYNWQFIDLIFQELRRTKSKVSEDVRASDQEHQRQPRAAQACQCQLAV